MSDTVPGPDPEALATRLREIGNQPLASRAAAFAQLHDELREKLESGDQPRSDG